MTVSPMLLDFEAVVRRLHEAGYDVVAVVSQPLACGCPLVVCQAAFIHQPQPQPQPHQDADGRWQGLGPGRVPGG